MSIGQIVGSHTFWFEMQNRTAIDWKCLINFLGSWLFVSLWINQETWTTFVTTG